MANYLLLRNNKESGPYSVDDLMELGLKAYDLVWAQGKSAAWRYPSEIEELKPFAPIVEEQPYDRFYKKQSETKKEEAPKQEVVAVAPEHEKYIPKKSVYVTMPGQKNSPVKAAIKEDTYIPAVATVQQTITVSENPAASQIKYSQPLDDIKEMYVKTLQERKQKMARKSFWLQGLKKAAVILSLVAIGVISGFIIKSNGSKKQDIAEKEKPSQPQQTITEPLANTEDKNNTLQQDAPQVILPPSGGYVNKESQPVKQDKPIELKKTSIDKPAGNSNKETLPKNSESEIKTSIAARPVDIDPVTGERSRKVRDENSNGSSNTNTEKRSFTATAISSLVSVTSNEYQKVAFGGIRDLQLTITNDSKYILDNVIVELQYLKPSEQPMRTENIQFTSIGPKATSTKRIPDTNRGIKVVYRIINVKSRQMDDALAGN